MINKIYKNKLKNTNKFNEFAIKIKEMVWNSLKISNLIRTSNNNGSNKGIEYRIIITTTIIIIRILWTVRLYFSSNCSRLKPMTLMIIVTMEE